MTPSLPSTFDRHLHLKKKGTKKEIMIRDLKSFLDKTIKGTSSKTYHFK